MSVADHSTSGSRVLVHRLAHTLIITLNRPEARNAVDALTATAVGEALAAAQRDADVSVVVITGVGPVAFCAGADLKALARGEDVTPATSPHRDWGFAGVVKHPFDKVLISAVNGLALGGGFEIVLASDLTVAAKNATFGFPEVTRGIFAAAGGAFRLPRSIPRNFAMELLLTGEPVNAARALELGLVNRVVPPEDVLHTALEIAERIGQNAPLSLRATKRVARGINQDGTDIEQNDWRRSQLEWEHLLSTHDGQEGLRAYNEKRQPKWLAR